jgi:hypothetical protein
LTFSSGGEKHDRFVSLFDVEKLTAAFVAMGHTIVTVYGEAYGGSQQKQAWRYGPNLRFVAFDVKIGETWLAVPEAAAFVVGLGLEFVHYERVTTDLAALDAQRDQPSTQAKRNGVAGEHRREGVVLRPIVEQNDQFGDRLIAKHKRAEERETNTERHVVDPAKAKVLADAEQIAIEWVTPTRLQHVLDKIQGTIDMTRAREVIRAMQEDVRREASGEIVESPQAFAAIASRTARLLKAHIDALMG